VVTGNLEPSRQQTIGWLVDVSARAAAPAFNSAAGVAETNRWQAAVGHWFDYTE
jgi:hypothetical protein